MKENYGISFYKKSSPFNTFTNVATTSVTENIDIASHISNSSIVLVQDQIAELNKVLDGIRVQEDWGEIMGSELTIFPVEGTVQIGYTNSRIPIQDFKVLLEEWLEFIIS
ncbi:hypothetical protein HDC92_002248 [Pedobacter sp. AK017]|uniref:hypothetical protein n=1 Tax=Pedobacter sp. AK017 TaxID=2723073 RepID=UPI00161A6616|nr:hypothetical protein [Pedobacter sp. AK017]MBB5438572.1 hypothetical protein [Pedobacter sp. AK017]